jgi:hypothetical protein
VTGYGISDEVFVTEWTWSDSIDEAVHRLSAAAGFPVSAADITEAAAFFRGCGVRLKHLTFRSPRR